MSQKFITQEQHEKLADSFVDVPPGLNKGTVAHLQELSENVAKTSHAQENAKVQFLDALVGLREKGVRLSESQRIQLANKVPGDSATEIPTGSLTAATRDLCFTLGVPMESQTVAGRPVMVSRPTKAQLSEVAKLTSPYRLPELMAA